MGVRGSDPNHLSALRVLCKKLAFRSRLIDYAPYLPFDPPTPSTPLAVSGLCRRHSRSSINSTPRHKRPNDPGHLVGKSNNHKHARLAGEHAPEPRSFRNTTPGRMTYHGARSDDKQAPQGSLAHLRCCAELLLSAGGALQWCQPQPGGEVATPFEGCGGRRQRDQGGCCYRPDPGNRCQPPSILILPSTTRNFDIKVLEMVHMMRKRQARYAFNPNPSLAEQFAILAT